MKTRNDHELKLPLAFKNGSVRDAEGSPFWGTDANWEMVVRAVNAHKELLAIVQAIAESFNAGANQVYAEALAPHTDDETLKTWINKAIAKATGGK